MDDATRWNSGKTAMTSLLLSPIYCHLLIFKIFSFLRRFWNKFGCTVEQIWVYCVNVITMMPENRSKFSRFPENHWVVSFIVYAFHTKMFFRLGVFAKLTMLTNTTEKGKLLMFNCETYGPLSGSKFRQVNFKFVVSQFHLSVTQIDLALK